MKIHPALNKTEVAERYYKQLGKFSTRDQAKKNFSSLKNPDMLVLRTVINSLYLEQLQMLELG